MAFIRKQTGDPPPAALNLPALFGGSHHWFFSPDFAAPIIDNTPGAESAVQPDSSGQGVICSNTLGACPIYNALDSGYGNRPTWEGDGSAKWFGTSWNPPAPATTKVWIYGTMCLRAGGNVVGGTLFGGASGTHIRFRVAATTPTVGMRNGGTENIIPITAGVWYRFIVNLTGVAGNDSFQLGSTLNPGLDLGNSNPVAFGILGQNAGTPGAPVLGGGSAGKFAFGLLYARVGNASLLTPVASVDAKLVARHGAGVQI